MAVKVGYTPTIFTAAGAETSVSIAWWFNDETQVTVYKNGILLTLTTDYTVTLPTNEATPDGSIDSLTALSASDTVRIVRMTDTMQLTDLLYGGKIGAAVLEKAYDLQMMRLQEIQYGYIDLHISENSNPFGDLNKTGADITGLLVPSTATGSILQISGLLRPGHRIRIIFSSSNISLEELNFPNTIGTAQGILLPGAADSWTDSVAGDVLCLVCDGVNYFTYSRSINS